VRQLADLRGVGQVWQYTSRLVGGDVMI
jgi:hypothetical protein